MNIRHQLALRLFQENDSNVIEIKPISIPIYENNKTEEIFKDATLNKKDIDSLIQMGKYEKEFDFYKIIFEYDKEAKEIKVFYIDFLEKTILDKKGEFLKMIEIYKYETQEETVKCTNHIKFDKNNYKISENFLTIYMKN
ncbi:hypothetical protein JMN12_14000 [Capnocytophaga genosp. AHN8471]|uniref:hypothetical protein n=1 Tax=Capnocytophaga genosp. AHN8471 TaxID=327574 RepID=UPI001931DE55|nr:hypothetical protein [Capnocytophaga genosp. AHN8471]MBM0657636.1 hypothetical protein [Capnocytophaga genosp. AHN8471]